MLERSLKELDGKHSLRQDLDEKLYQETVAEHPELEKWASLGRAWLETVDANKNMFRSSIRKFLNLYLIKCKLPTDPGDFLRSDFKAPCYYETCLKELSDRSHVRWSHSGIMTFLAYVLAREFSAVDAEGHAAVLPGYANPIPQLPADLFSKRKDSLAGGASDTTFKFVLKVDPALENWRILAETYLQTLKRGVSNVHLALGQFLTKYICGLNMPRDPATFLRAGFDAPCIYENLFSHLKSRTNALAHINSIRGFLEWVLIMHFSSEDDDGKPIVSPEFRNPFQATPQGLETTPRNAKQESEKSVLPYKYIAQLRKIICPDGAVSFRDWQWAQSATDHQKGGDWVYVQPDALDYSDPDCVWRKRETTGYEREIHGLDKEVYEIWCPVRSVALYVKLQLPLRTYQVRMLDSGEADTKRYCEGQWVENQGPLRSGSMKYQVRKGVFREMGNDNATHTPLTGLFINTNKTADSYKDELGKGYELPWQHDEVLFWLEKLRNWQERYNPIARQVAWTELSVKQLEKVKSQAMLKEMGAACFLFRYASGLIGEKDKPMPASPIEKLWTKALAELQSQCEAEGLVIGGQPVEFVTKAKPTDVRPLYPLHSLRVSLITAYALEGGVPMPVLSKCIAGHSRLVMTLYYTKVGISYVTGMMSEAEKNLAETEQTNFMSWLRDATHKQLETGGAFVDPQALRAVLAAQGSGASLIKDDKGICPKGAQGCNSGGIYPNEDTGVVAYGAVPGYPQKNCVQCRWFFTGPAFLPGLVDHWNYVGYQMSEVGERVIDFEQKIMALEDEQLSCHEIDMPFTRQPELDALRKYYQTEIETNNKLATDYQATLRLITRCKALQVVTDPSGGVQLVAVGSQADVEISITECSRLQQILTTVAGSRVFAENDVSKAVMQAGKAYDLMLSMNGKQPVLFALSDEELKHAVQEITKLLQAQTGSLSEAVPFIEGQRRLAELGLDVDMANIVKGLDQGKLTFDQRSPRPKGRATALPPASFCIPQ